MYYSKQYMNQAKRQLSVDMSSDDDTKKLRTCNENQLKSCIEDLSNELIYEIFDYFDIRELYHIFLNLNQRFQNLFLYSNLPLKFHSSSNLYQQSFELICLQIILPNKHRIISLNLSKRSEFIQFFTLSTIDSSFHHLQSLILYNIKFNEIISLLPTLTILPLLFSLKISLDDTLNDFQEIYYLIFRLPMLKYHKLSAKKIVLQDSISFSNLEQFSSIEQLVLDYPCTLNELYNILSYTPKLCHLICKNFFQLNFNSFPNISFQLFHLTSCTIRLCYLKFDEFEIFIKKISSQLRLLHFIPLNDITYLDADRWERLIVEFIPYLHTFYFKYSDVIFGQLNLQSYHTLIHRFTSLFWIEKGWIFNIQIDLNYWPPIEIIYSIQSYKKQWYDSFHYEYNNNSQLESMDILKPLSQLTVRNCHFEQYEENFIDFIQLISSLTKLTSLSIEFNYFSIDILIEFLNLLSNLDYLTIKLKNFKQIQHLTEEQINKIHKISNMNKILKLNLEQIVDKNQIEILLNLCPHIEYLQIQCMDYLDLQSIIRLILIKKQSNLSSLCFLIPKADEIMVKNLQTIFINYKIHRIYDRIYLQLEKH